MLFFTFLFLAVGDWMLRNESEESQTWDILKSVCVMGGEETEQRQQWEWDRKVSQMGRFLFKEVGVRLTFRVVALSLGL